MEYSKDIILGINYAEDGKRTSRKEKKWHKFIKFNKKT